MTSPENIVEILSESAKTLAAALKAADLISTLSGEGPFTVFAPIDAAFEKIQSDVDTLLLTANKVELSKILTCHVVSGKHMAKDLTDGSELTTVQGEKLRVYLKDDKVLVGDAHVTAADIGAFNGVIHLIDKVLMPKL